MDLKHAMKIRQLGLKVACLLLATLSQNATAGWRVAELNGAPGLFLDDRPVAPIMFWQWEAEEPDMKALADAGVKLFGIFEDVVLSANRAWLMLHTRKRGPYAVRLPRSVKTVRDVTSGAVVARDCDSFTCELEQFQTAVFLLVDR